LAAGIINMQNDVGLKKAMTILGRRMGERSVLMAIELMLARKEDNMAKKGVPKKDGSGKGKRGNRGRGGCSTTKPKGKGK